MAKRYQLQFWWVTAMDAKAEAVECYMHCAVVLDSPKHPTESVGDTATAMTSLVINSPAFSKSTSKLDLRCITPGCGVTHIRKGGNVREPKPDSAGRYALAVYMTVVRIETDAAGKESPLLCVYAALACPNRMCQMQSSIRMSHEPCAYTPDNIDRCVLCFIKIPAGTAIPCDDGCGERVYCSQKHAAQDKPRHDEHKAFLAYLESKRYTCVACESVGYGFQRCSRCRTMRYCGKPCQLAHWPTHKTTCTPWDSA